MSKKRLSGAVKKNPTSTKANLRNDGGRTDALIRAIFPGESEMARRMRDFDWSATELGPPQNWPENLRITARILLTSRFPIVVWWGPNFSILYNDAYIPFLGEQKHPYYLGQPGRECWQEIWETIGPMLEGVYRTGVATWSDDFQFFFARNLPREEVYVTFTYGPILSADGGAVEGVFCPCTETTEKIVGARRLDTLRKLGVQALETRTVEAACAEAARVLAENSHDIPFAAIYLVNGAGTRAELKSLAGFPQGAQPFPSSISISDGDISPWPLASTLQSRRAAETSDLTGAGLRLPGGPWPEPASKAVVLPIFAAECETLSGLAVLGVSPRRVFDDAYRTFFGLIAGHIGTAISDVMAYEAEQKRAEALAEIDRERVESLAREREARKEAETLNQVSRTLAGELDSQKLAQRVTDAGVKLTGAEFCAFFYNVVNEQGEAYRLYTLSGAPREAFEKFGVPRNTPLFEGAFRGAGVVRSDDILKHPDYGKNPPHHCMPRGHLPVRSYMAAPVVSRSGAVLGGLFFGHPEPGVFTERAERIAVGIAAQAAIAIDNARLFAEAEKEIAQRKQAEEALRESEERFRHMADNAPALIWVTSPTECEFVNREYLEFLGVGEAEVLGDNWAKFVHPEDRENYVNAFREAVSSRSRFEGEFRFRRRDGEYRWMQSVGTPRFERGEFKGYVGSSHDIHERKLAETAMAQMAAIVESSHAAIISKDLNGIITSWNKGAERLFGYTAEEVIGKPVTILIPPDRGDEEQRILERLRRGERVDHYETVRRRKNGQEIDISLTISPIRDKTGKAIGASKIARDISERKRIEAEREELLLKESAARAEAEAARAEAEAANRSKDEFLAVVSHELRSPLNAILGYNRMIRERRSDESHLKRSCDIIERNARTQLQLIEDLLDTARIGSGKLRLELRKLDIIPVIVDALDIMRPAAAAKGVRLRIADCGLRIADSQSSIDHVKTTAPVESENRDRTAHGENQSAIRNPQSAIMLGDAARLQQIVWNLLSNAIKFTPAGGSVEILAERAGEHIRIIVSDTGKGIQPEFMPHIFDRFQQRDSSSSQRTGGLGLGLALVKHLTELHGGKVEAMSEGAGRGSAFTVTLPLVAQIELDAAEVPALAAILTGGEAQTTGGTQSPAGLTIAGVRVLVVDDHEDARIMLAEFLSLCGAVVTTASSGAEALMVLSNPPGGAPPDIMLCDIAMPGEDGYTALRRVRALEEARGVAASERIPAIALTALTGAKERLRALSAGFRLHLAKPVDPVELMFTIANALGILKQEGRLH